MKKLSLFTLIASVFLLNGCSGIVGNGKAVEETRTVSPLYRGIVVEKAIRVIISDKVTDVHVRADELFMPYLKTYVNEDNLLVITYSKSMIGYSSVATEVTVPYHSQLGSFNASGASRIDSECEVVLNQASFEASEASHLKFFGSVINCNIKLSGASRFEGFDFTAITLDCELSGASRMEITCEGAMKIKASGASTVLYKGNCVITSIETSGASEVTKK
ncbi:MAG: DUF2807 domain-containing protein [Bacteroidales bacterium]|nr:DUF2807 domain-containing protein [Bacteroidales bacterium]MDD3522161.1 DUF2807 domain-containing protein [Bacteroidales bacterium]MDD4029977.1 DUF2807 domain-containing protein [Bacteroidales bacterium]MDD4434752.1 DUF2807 domain-containing protein [Bacteroidales bacterium]MDD5732711.1 DUF2807 domain-containing protein [Bacteroidales bacterium]